MPTYEFRCPDGHEFEKFYRTISGAESMSACPVCGKMAERFMSATGFAFKGSGFYLTDYGKNAHRGEAAPAATSSNDGGSASSADGAKTDVAKTAGADSKADSKSEKPSAAEPKPAASTESKPAAPPKPSQSE